ncbi:MAG: class I SAM-dependent methyltransferase [Verrucomicrobia bacterium]|nr:class I SAM-dependent methyltransferase [Verrucomicrobiota bacterium]
MNARLQQESKRLAGAWERHDSAMLRHYLVAGVEDPRLNVQSILSRHFLATALFGDRFQTLMAHELQFAAAMNWLLHFLPVADDAAERGAVLHALRRGADNAEGIELPPFLVRTFATLPARLPHLTVPNYLEAALARPRPHDAPPGPASEDLDTFAGLWRQALTGAPNRRLSVLEPACGSANDYRAIDAAGLGRFLDYTGFDLCGKNVANARAQFPHTRFEIANVFAIPAENGAFEVCIVHDLFEHLSPEGLDQAVAEVCRVTRLGLCAGFFNVDEIPEHIVRPVEDYYWNTLSLERLTRLFVSRGFTAQVLNVSAYLRARTGCEQTHNANAYTLLLYARTETPRAGGLP